MKQEHISWDPPERTKPKVRRGYDPDERLEDDDPERENVDRARILIEEGVVEPALRAMEIPFVELAFRAGVNKGTLSRYAKGERPLPATTRGATIARQFINYVEKAEARAQRLAELRDERRATRVEIPTDPEAERTRNLMSERQRSRAARER